jgi:hypothetical protein
MTYHLLMMPPLKRLALLSHACGGLTCVIVHCMHGVHLIRSPPLLVVLAVEFVL